jgi:hypothetical protein
MSSRLHLLFSAALPLAVAVACTKPADKTVQASVDQVTAIPAKPTPAPADSIKGKERRPLQPWGHYWLTD